jgi:DNA polymerase III delta subunit
MNLSLDTVTPSGALRCFVLSGDDSVGIEHARATITAHLEKTGGPLTHEHFDPANESIALFIQSMLSPTLFGDLRVFHFRHVEDFSDADLDELNNAFECGIPDAFAIVELHGPKKDTAKAHKKLRIEQRAGGDEPFCLQFESARPPDWGIADWLVTNAPLLIGRQIAKPDAEYLADRVGRDLDLLHSELQKIDLHLPEKARIDRKTIDLIAGKQREMTAFELAAALGRRDLVAALRVVDAIFTGAPYLPPVIAALGRHFWALFRIKKFCETNPDICRRFTNSKGFKNPEQTATGLAIGRAAGLLGDKDANRIYPVLIKSGIMEQTALFSGDEIERIIAWLHEFDWGIKTGRVAPDRTSLEMLCYRCVRVRSIAGDRAAV